MSKANPLEKAIEKKVCDHAKELGCIAYKFTSPARRSVPDRLFIMPAGTGCFFIEFKRKGCHPTEAQKIEIAKIRAQGTRVFVIDDVASGKACVADMLHGVACESTEMGYRGCDSTRKGDCSFCGPYAKKSPNLDQASPKQKKPAGGAVVTMDDPLFSYPII